MNTHYTRLLHVTDPSANEVESPVVAECTLHDPEGRVFLLRVTCGSTADIVPSAEAAVDNLELDLGVSDWRAA